MIKRTATALKEWAVVCRALQLGRQTVLIRKGGLIERRGEFEVENTQFWLYPTFEHQSREKVRADAYDLFDDLPTAPPADQLHLDLFAVVVKAARIDDWDRLSRLGDAHIWTQAVVAERFGYRSPGVYVLVLRVYRRSVPHRFPQTAQYAGCRSWVQLDMPLTTDKLAPVLTDTAFEVVAAQIDSVLSGL
jgi:hypothetical protein